jgi:TRAP-type transport system periplasmic protein
MKRPLGVFWAFVLIAVALFAYPGCAGPQPAKVIALTYADFFPLTNWNSTLAQLWCEEIKKQTGGRVEISYYPGGKLATSDKIAEAVADGAADIGMSCTAYTLGRFPATELIDMPHGYPSGWIATKVAWDFLKKFKLAEWEKYHLLYFHAHGPQVIFTTNKPVRKVEDLQGLVVRSTGIGAKIIEALGGRGYAAGQGVAYELMSDGTIDGSFTPGEPLKGWKQIEVVNYVTATYGIGSTAGFFVAMNRARWDALPKDVQDKFTSISQEWVDKHAMSWAAYDKAAFDLFKSTAGKEFIELNGDEMADFVAAARPALDAYMAERANQGLPVVEYEKYLNERVSYWAKKTPSEKACLDWVERNIVPFGPAPLSVTFDGWYANGVKVTTAARNTTVIPRLTMSGGIAGQYQLRIRRDISSGKDATVNEIPFDYNGISIIKELSFSPPYATNELSTNGYHIDILKDGNTLFTLINAYPPRLRVSP